MHCLYVATSYTKSSPSAAIASPWAKATCHVACAGVFVAGLQAGHAYNTFPKMNGAWVPPEYWDGRGWRNAFENTAAVQARFLRNLVFVELLSDVSRLCSCTTASWRCRRSRPSAPPGLRTGGPRSRARPACSCTPSLARPRCRRVLI